MSSRVTIIGDGQMALAMADALVTRQANVTIWGPLPAEVQRLAKERISPRLPEYRLPASVRVTGDEAMALDGAEYIISAIPTQFLRSVWQKFAAVSPSKAVIVSVTKGVEIGSERRPSEVIAECLAQHQRSPTPSICVLSGPSIASELIRHLPCSLVAASRDQHCSECVQQLLRVPWLRIYRHDDVIGVELAGATKNVIALAAGMIDGMKAGDNAKSALLARGLAEIARLGVAMGAKLDTFFGIAGVGDLATTCFSPEGRNRTCGERLGQGEPLDATLASMNSVVEGVPTTKAVMQMAREHDVDMPITNAIHQILFEGLSPQQAMKELMGRDVQAEHVG